MPNIRLKRYTGAVWEELEIQTDYSQILNKPTTFTPTAHTHGQISNGGAITAAVVTPGNGDTLVITDTSDSGFLKRGVTIGTGTTTFLRNDGNWATPSDTTTLTGLGITATATELNFVDGVTSSVQTQINGKAATSHTHTVANITDIASNYVGVSTTQTITGYKTFNGIQMANNAGIAKSYSVGFQSGATYGGPSIRGNTLGELERTYYTATATIFDTGNSTAWDTLRYRGDAVSLTSTGASGTTGGSIAAGATLAQGDTIMMEVSSSSVVSTGNEVAVVIFTLGAADTDPTSLTQGVVYRTSWSSSLIFYHYTFKVSHSGSTLYFDDSFRITFTDTSTASNILAQTSVTLHVGRIWRLYDQL
jgi:hypothetical protein